MSRSITPSIQTFRRNSSASAEKTHGLQSFGITITKKKEIPHHAHRHLRHRLLYHPHHLRHHPPRNKEPSIMNNPLIPSLGKMTPEILAAKIKLALEEVVDSMNLGLSVAVIPEFHVPPAPPGTYVLAGVKFTKIITPETIQSKQNL